MLKEMRKCRDLDSEDNEDKKNREARSSDTPKKKSNKEKIYVGMWKITMIKKYLVNYFEKIKDTKKLQR